jgi:hypothetical protein
MRQVRISTYHRKIDVGGASARVTSMVVLLKVCDPAGSIFRTIQGSNRLCDGARSV